MDIKSWKQYFDRTILNRGKSYYDSGKVKGLTHKGNTYEAVVLGTDFYKVKIEISDHKYPIMHCTCPYGGYCKHEAAVFYAIEQMRKKEGNDDSIEEQKRYVTPFKKEDNGSYSYFDLEAMTEGMTFLESDVKKAQNLIATGLIQLTAVNLNYDRYNRSDMEGEVIGKVDDDDVVISFSRNRINSAECNVYRCYGRYYHGYSAYIPNNKLCVHEIALLLLLQEYMKKESIGDATDYYGNAMLSSFRNKRKSKVEGQEILKANVLLEPFLEKKYEGLQLGFKIGTEHLYMLKKLSDFVDTVEKKGNWPLGSKSSIDFAFSTFTPNCKAYYDFIKSIVLTEHAREGYVKEAYDYYYGTDVAGNIKDRIGLFGNRIDSFFPLVEGKKIPVTLQNDYFSKETSEWFFKDGNPNIQLDLNMQEDDKKVFHGVRLTGDMPKFIDGVDYKYFVQDEYFYRVDNSQLAELQPLLDCQENGRIDLSIGRKLLSEFYYRVLPTIEKYVTVNRYDQNKIQEYLPPEAEFNFLLDLQDGQVLCKVEAIYGEDKYNLIDRYKSDIKVSELRDSEMERTTLEQIKPYFPYFDTEKECFISLDDSDSIYNILQNGVPLLMRLGQVLTTDRFSRLSIRKKIPVNVGVSVGSDIMNLEIQSTELSQEELLDVLNSYRKKLKYHRLKNGEFVDLDGDNLQELVDLMEALHITPKEFVKGKMKQPLYRALYLDKMLEQCQDVYSERDFKFKQLIKNFKTVEDAEYEVPKSLQKILRKYQKYGYRWLRTLENCHFGGILADDMGLGKTLQVITLILSHKNEATTNLPALIVTPASLVYNWKEEFARFAPTLEVSMIVGNQIERSELIENYQKADVLVTSYDLLKRDIDQYEDKSFSLEIIDEAQYIKNHTTAASKSVKLISATTRFALTGTPIENRLSELWSIFDYLMPGFLYSYENFRKEIETPIAKNNDEAVTLQLKRMVSPFILRRLKADVLKDLPDKLEENYYAVMDSEQQKLYDGQVVKMKQTLQKTSEENFKKTKLQVLAELTKIRQICCDPSLLFDNYLGQSAKRAVCIQLIENAIEGEHKVLLFSQFTSMLALLEKDLKAAGINYYKITGETNKQKRIDLVQQFNADDTPVFLISLKAGGTGLNLAGADIVIHYDPWWNVAAQNQATDRAHRIGQTKTVSVYKLIVKNSIEEKILKMQEDKKNLADAILNGESSNIMDMTKDDLLQLLG